MFKLFKKKVATKEVQTSLKDDVLDLKKSLKKLIVECKEQNKKLHEVCVQISDNVI